MLIVDHQSPGGVMNFKKYEKLNNLLYFLGFLSMVYSLIHAYIIQVPSSVLIKSDLSKEFLLSTDASVKGVVRVLSSNRPRKEQFIKKYQFRRRKYIKQGPSEIGYNILPR